MNCTNFKTLFLEVNRFPHSEHWCLFASPWSRTMWLSNPSLVLYLSPQILQANLSWTFRICFKSAFLQFQNYTLGKKNFIETMPFRCNELCRTHGICTDQQLTSFHAWVHVARTFVKNKTPDCNGRRWTFHHERDFSSVLVRCSLCFSLQ